VHSLFFVGVPCVLIPRFWLVYCVLWFCQPFYAAVYCSALLALRRHDACRNGRPVSFLLWSIMSREKLEKPLWTNFSLDTVLLASL
jgi:hypothetical protein